MATRTRNNVTLQAHGLSYHLIISFSIKVMGLCNHPANLQLCMILTMAYNFWNRYLQGLCCQSRYVCWRVCLCIIESNVE